MVCLKATGTLAWPRATGPFFPGPWPTGTLAWFLGAHWLIGSLAHWHWPGLICLASFVHCLIGSLALA